MSLNIDYNSRFTHDYTNPTYGKEPVTGSVSKYNYRTTGMTFNNVVNYTHTFKEAHNLRLMAGQEYSAEAAPMCSPTAISNPTWPPR